MVIQFIKFKTTLSEEEVMEKANERLSQFQALPGLLQKYYVKGAEPNQYGGIYIWDSLESLKAYRESDLAKSIAESYKVVGQPSIEVMDVVLGLRD